MTATDLIDAYLEHLRLRRRSDYTIRERGIILRRADRQLPYGLDEAGEHELLTWLGGDGWSPATRSTYDTCLRAFYRYAVSETCPDPLELDPMETVPPFPTPKSLPKPCTDEELAILLARAREPYRTWCVLAAFGGLRCIEISRLDREHVDPRGIRLWGKGGKPRMVPTHELVWETVRNIPAGPLARARGGGRLPGRYVSRNALVHFQHDLGVAVSMHRLRHWCLSRIQRAIGDLRVTQEIAGHSSPATTAIYTLVDDAQRTAAVRSLPRPGATGGPCAADGADGAGRTG